jgi:hypothetical protein
MGTPMIRIVVPALAVGFVVVMVYALKIMAKIWHLT